MNEKPKPLHPVRPPRTAEERAEWGRLQPIRYPDSPSKRLGNKLLGWLTAWKR